MSRLKPIQREAQVRITETERQALQAELEELRLEVEQWAVATTRRVNKLSEAITGRSGPRAGTAAGRAPGRHRSEHCEDRRSVA